MSIRRLIASPRTRRSVAAGIVVLSLGGLVLARAPQAQGGSIVSTVGQGTFRGPGAQGSVALSHRLVEADRSERVFAELRLRADDLEDVAAERAPLSLAIVLDTSGSMSGKKLREAKRSVVELIGRMHADDKVTLVRYSSDASVVHRLTRVGDSRQRLIEAVESLSATGGTDIPAGLERGLSALEGSDGERVQRVVLVSDGLDEHQARAQRLSRRFASRGITVSTLGVGLDFDEDYLAGLARGGHGNFGFVKDSASLARFLSRELDETAQTTVKHASVKLRLPDTVRFVRAIGASARPARGGDQVTLDIGGLHAGDERRVVVELEVDAEAGERFDIGGVAEWTTVSGERARASLGHLALKAVEDGEKADAARNHGVFARCMSAVASWRNLEASAAYKRGDTAKAKRLINQNLQDLGEAEEAAPAEQKENLKKQRRAYRATRGLFGSAAPGSAEGRAAAKASTAADSANLGRQSF